MKNTTEAQMDVFDNSLELELYKIEEFTEAPPRWGGKVNTRRDFFKDLLAKVDRPGLKFVIKKGEEHTLRCILKEFYPEYKMRISTIPDNPDFKRVYRIL